MNRWVCAILLLLGINILTTELYPSVWMDEVMFTDPAANWHFGKGFTSTAWAFQSKDAFWAGNAPLHSLLLCAWFKVFGFGIYQTRIFGYVFWSLAVFCLCLSARRLGWIASQNGLLLLVLLAFLGQGDTFAYRSGRYEPLAVLVIGFCLLAFSIQRTHWRYGAILAASALFLPTCLPLGPFCVLMSILLLLVTRWKYVRELAAIATGLAVGFGLLYIFYNHFGVWNDFLKSIHGLSKNYYNGNDLQNTSTARTGLEAVFLRKMADSIRVLIGNKSSLILLLAIILQLAARKKNTVVRHPQLLLFVLLAFFVIPIGQLLIYAFPIYYWWMRYLLLCVGFVVCLETIQLPVRSSTRNLFAVGVVCAASVFGLPGRLAVEELDGQERDYGRVETFIQNSIKPEDVVFADAQAFYPLQKLKVRTYYSWYLLRITPAEEASVDCLVIDPSWLPRLKVALGGEWEATGQVYLHEEHFGIKFLDRLMPNYFNQQTNRKYNLAIYRRVLPAARARPAP